MHTYRADYLEDRNGADHVVIIAIMQESPLQRLYDIINMDGVRQNGPES